MPSNGNIPENILVADIGGTNARLAIASFPEASGAPVLSNFQAYPCAAFHNAEAVLEQYLAEAPNPRPDYACLAVAGPVTGGATHLTNLGWHLDSKRLEKQFSFKKLELVNDFAALGRSVTALGTKDLITLKTGVKVKHAPCAVMGPGTGFGLSILVQSKAGPTVISTEGGHGAFVPQGEQETAVWAALQQSLGRITVETMLSGVGLMRIYRELCHIHSVAPLNYEPHTITQLATDGGDPLCLESLEIFCGIMGSVAGDLALVLGARGGIFLGGGILPKVADFFVGSNFLERFLNKPPMSHVMKDIPVFLITAPDAALRGAALLFEED